MGWSGTYSAAPPAGLASLIWRTTGFKAGYLIDLTEIPLEPFGLPPGNSSSRTFQLLNLCNLQSQTILGISGHLCWGATGMWWPFFSAERVCGISIFICVCIKIGRPPPEKKDNRPVYPLSQGFSLFFQAWRPSLLGWSPSLLGPSLLGWRPLLFQCTPI